MVSGTAPAGRAPANQGRSTGVASGVPSALATVSAPAGPNAALPSNSVKAMPAITCCPAAMPTCAGVT